MDKQKQQRINEAISAWFEPKPPASIAEVCKTKYWIYRFVNSCPEDGDDTIEVLPLDYFTIEADNAKLMEAMAAVNAYVWLEWDINEWCVMWKPTTEEAFDNSIEYSHKNRLVAIVLAFCAFAKIPPVKATTNG